MLKGFEILVKGSTGSPLEVNLIEVIVKFVLGGFYFMRTGGEDRT